MDYQDKLAGIDHDYFTNKGKLLLLDMLLKRINQVKNSSILSIGCGDGHELEVLKKYGSVDVIDINKRAIELIPKKLYSKAYLGDLCDTIIKKKYDLVIGLDILEHIRDDEEAVGKIHDLLRPKGFFLFTVPAHQSLFSAHDKALKHCRRYSKQDLKSLLAGKFKRSFLSYRYFFLFIPVLISKLLNKNTKPKIEAPKVPKFINKSLLCLLKIEIDLMSKGIFLPCGISLVGVYKKI